LQTPFKHIALADAACPLGKCSKAYLEQHAVYEKLLPRAVHVDNSRAVLAALHGGKADIGLVFASDAVTEAGCHILLRVRHPRASVEYAGTVVRGGHEAEARSLLDFIASPTAWGCFRQCGFQPIGKS